MLYQESCVNLVVLFFLTSLVTVVAQINLNRSQRQAAPSQTERKVPKASKVDFERRKSAQLIWWELHVQTQIKKTQKQSVTKQNTNCRAKKVAE